MVQETEVGQENNANEPREEDDSDSLSEIPFGVQECNSFVEVTIL